MFNLGIPGTGMMQLPLLFSYVQGINAVTLKTAVMTALRGTSVSISAVVPNPFAAPFQNGAVEFDATAGQNTYINTVVVVGCKAVVTSYPGLPQP